MLKIIYVIDEKTFKKDAIELLKMLSTSQILSNLLPFQSPLDPA